MRGMDRMDFFEQSVGKTDTSDIGDKGNVLGRDLELHEGLIQAADNVVMAASFAEREFRLVNEIGLAHRRLGHCCRTTDHVGESL